MTANIRWVINTAGPWHTLERIGFTALLAWLPFHFGLPFTDWPSVVEHRRVGDLLHGRVAVARGSGPVGAS